MSPGGTEIMCGSEGEGGLLPLRRQRAGAAGSCRPRRPIAKFLEKNGGHAGIQHVAIRVPDIRAAIAEMKEKGYRMIDEEPRYGAGGASIAFVHPKSTGGVLIELTQRT